MPDYLSLVWCNSAHFAKFLILRFSKRYSFNIFHQNSTKRYTKYHDQGLIWLLLALLDSVSRAHGMGGFVRRPTSVRPLSPVESVSQLS